MTARYRILIVWSTFCFTLVTSCVSFSPSFKEQWLKIVPGQTSIKDVSDLLGSPSLKSQGPLGEVWCYEPVQTGSGCVEFKDDRVLTRSSTLGLNLPANLDPVIAPPYALVDLLRDYGAPNIIYESITPSDPFGTPLIERWVFSYPEKGFDATLGYPANIQPGNAPNSDTRVDTRVFYAPLSINEYRAIFPSKMYGIDVREVMDVDQYLKSTSSH